MNLSNDGKELHDHTIKKSSTGTGKSMLDLKVARLNQLLKENTIDLLCEGVSICIPAEALSKPRVLQISWFTHSSVFPSGYKPVSPAFIYHHKVPARQASHISNLFETCDSVKDIQLLENSLADEVSHSHSNNGSSYESDVSMWRISAETHSSTWNCSVRVCISHHEMNITQNANLVGKVSQTMTESGHFVTPDVRVHGSDIKKLKKVSNAVKLDILFIIFHINFIHAITNVCRLALFLSLLLLLSGDVETNPGPTGKYCGKKV